MSDLSDAECAALVDTLAWDSSRVGLPDVDTEQWVWEDSFSAQSSLPLHLARSCE